MHWICELVEGMMLDRKQVACPPQGRGITVGQLVEVVVNYLRDHPEARHYAANSVAGVALKQAFPCKDQAH